MTLACFVSRIACISFVGEALRIRPRPSRLARNNYEHTYMHCKCSHQPGDRYVARRPRALPGVEAACLGDAGCAPPVRGWCALWWVCGRVARSGGRAGRASWSPATSWRPGSRCSRCCGPIKGQCALVLVLPGCCGLCAPTHTCDFAHAASVLEVWRR